MPRRIFPKSYIAALLEREGEKWAPGSDLERDLFLEAWCKACRHSRECEIQHRALTAPVLSEFYPWQWRVTSKGPECAAFSSRRRLTPSRCPKTLEMCFPEPA